MSKNHWICAVPASMLGLGFAVMLQAELPRQALVPLPAATPAKLAAPAKPLQPIEPVASEEMSGCIVLRDGTVHLGKLVELAAGYQVQTAQGTHVVPFDQVRTVAESLPLAYRQIRASYQNPTAADHLEIGRWCADQGLMQEAKTEAEDALLLEPQRKEAVELIRLAESKLGRVKTKEIPVEKEAPARRIVSPEIALGTVSSKAQVEFIRHIQPLTFNRCGNANCHGPASNNDFKLAPVRSGASPQRVRSEQNLVAILKWIDIANPAESDLLVKPRSLDGVHNGLFQGDRGTEQYKRIAAWVELVAKDQAFGSPVAKPKEVGDWREGPRISVKPRVSESDDSEIAQASNVENPPPSGAIQDEEPTASQRPTTGALRSEKIQRLLSNHAPDAFDPEEFNRLVHGDQPPPTPSLLPE